MVLKRHGLGRFVIVTHVKEIIEQNAEKMLGHWPEAPVGVYSASVGKREVAPITFAGIQTVHRRFVEFGKVDVLIIDEAHMVGPNPRSMYLKFITGLRQTNPNLRVIGLTATPYRLGMGHLTEGPVFTDIAVDLCSLDAYNKLLEQGYLTRLITRGTDMRLNVEGVSIQAGEYVQRELEEQVNQFHITEQALDEVCLAGSERRHWLIFAAGVNHAHNIAKALVERDIACEVVIGELDRATREDILQRFKEGKIRAVVNNNVLTTGFDFPGIDLVACLRPTQSSALWVQMLGRGSRIADGKDDCLVLDFANNALRLGPINDPLIPKPPGVKGNGSAPVRECPECHTVVHISAPVCPQCGYEFPRIRKIGAASGSAEVIAESGLQLVDVLHTEYRRHRKPGKPDSLRVTYVYTLPGPTKVKKSISEWICLEHGGYAASMARFWWLTRDPNYDLPDTVDKALECVKRLPKTLRIAIKFPEGRFKGFPEIKGHEIQSHEFEQDDRQQSNVRSSKKATT